MRRPKRCLAAIFVVAVAALLGMPRAWAQTLDWEPKTTEFGRVPQGATEVRTLALFRTDEDSSKVLNVTAIEYTFNQAGAFDWLIDGTKPDFPIELPIPPAAPLELELTFTPNDFSFFMADLQITNTSVNAPVLIYSLLGEGQFATTTTAGPTTTVGSTTTTVGGTTTTTLAPLDCGDPSGDGKITATDALFTLTVAVGTKACSLKVCDVNDDGKVAATDALVILNASVGNPVELVCPV